MSSFAENGVLYYPFECSNVEPFADHTVYLAVYEGTHIPSPSAERFAFGDDGSISVQPGKEAALFTLPLDPVKAAPEKASQFQFLPSAEPVSSEKPENLETFPDSEEGSVPHPYRHAGLTQLPA